MRNFTPRKVYNDPMQIDIAGVNTNYEIVHPEGQTTLLILHGWGSAASFWIPLANLLSPHLRIILLDLPGFGLSDPLPGSPEIPQFTDFVHSFAKKMFLSKYILAGHSFGGQIALDYGIKYPEDLQSMILISPALLRENLQILELKASFLETIKPLLNNDPTNQIEKYLGWFTPKNYDDANEYQRRVLQNIIHYNLKPLLGNLKVKTDIVWGSDDIVVPNEGDYLQSKIHHSRLHLIKGANHLLHLTHLKELSQNLNEILKI